LIFNFVPRAPLENCGLLESYVLLFFLTGRGREKFLAFRGEFSLAKQRTVAQNITDACRSIHERWASGVEYLRQKSWRRKMNAKVRMTILGIMLCALVIAGCRRNGVATVEQNSRTANDIRKVELQKELDKKWENPVAHYELGQLYHAEGDWSKAEYYYNIALGFNSAYREVQAAMVKLQLNKGDKSKADWLANNYITQVVSMPEQVLSLGAAFEKQGLDDFALDCYNKALKATPDSWQVNRQLGYYYLNKNKKDLTKEYFIRSFQLNPNQPDVANELGKLGVAIRVPQPPAPEGTSQPAKPAAPLPK
jgi:tetratricopeptide (TPR) repeat protein